MTAFKAFIVLTLLATGSCSSLPQAGDEEYESRPKADEGYKVCKNPLKWSTPGCKKLFETMKKENPTEKNTGRIINGEDVPFGEYPWFAKPLEYWAGWYGKFPYPASAESISKHIDYYIHTSIIHWLDTLIY
mmetsp:Transcript_20692/g.30548  ORF Transcript_20692/g.30548 Transcript_20692/m.30548 type:complete len:132 (-) Transcript_20692:1486-1881(-)